MGRVAALLIFSAIGFSIGFLGFLASPTVYNLLSSSVPGIALNKALIGAIVAGGAGSVTSLMLLMRWSKKP